MRRLTLLLVPAALLAAQARYARLGDFEGKVEVQLTAADDWTPAERNLPLMQSSWVRTGASSRVEIELDEGSVWRLGPNSQCEISDYSRLSTGQRITLLLLDRGLAYFTGHPEGKDALTLAVPGAQATLTRAGRLRLEVEESWSQISVLDGIARFSSPAAEIDLRQGQTTRVEPANPARFFLGREITPLELDRWSEGRDKALANPVSAGHLIERYGLADLDTAGEWIQTEDLGAVWKPKVADNWAPFRSGRWRWYDPLGYTWVSDDAWGWLPYHYGRWTRRDELGWIWAPAKTAVFKPGEVYWLRGARLAGWGPLAPGEEWKPSGTRSEPPRQYLAVNTTFAGFQQDSTVIDPTGFAARPKEPLMVASFAAALPSPAFVASRLDATRPLLAARTRVTPVVEGVTFQSASAPAVVVMNAPPPPPVVVIAEPPQDPPQPAPPVAYPVPVYTGIVVVNPPGHPEHSRRTTLQPTTASTQTNPKPQPAAPPPAVPARPRPGLPAGVDRPPVNIGKREKKFRSPGEQAIASQVISDIAGNNFAKAVNDLDTWMQRFPQSDYDDDRLYYYIVAYNGDRQPGKVVETARQMFLRSTDLKFQDARQTILALYLTSLNFQKVSNPNREQFGTAAIAARSLLNSIPEYFVPENKPPETSSAEWSRARAELETAAKATLAALAARTRPSN